MSVSIQYINDLVSAPTMREAVRALNALYLQLMASGKPKSAQVVLRLHNEFDGIMINRPASIKDEIACYSPWAAESHTVYMGGTVPASCRLPKNLEQKLINLANALEVSGIDSSAIDPLDNELADTIDTAVGFKLGFGISGIVVVLGILYFLLK